MMRPGIESAPRRPGSAPGPPRDPVKARLLRLYTALHRRFGRVSRWGATLRVKARSPGARPCLLRAARRPVFVADAPVRRILARHRFIDAGAGYEEVRRWMEAHLPSDPELFKGFHALLVAVGQSNCRALPRCEGCPLRFDLRGRRPGP